MSASSRLHPVSAPPPCPAVAERRPRAAGRRRPGPGSAAWAGQTQAARRAPGGSATSCPGHRALEVSGETSCFLCAHMRRGEDVGRQKMWGSVSGWGDPSENAWRWERTWRLRVTRPAKLEVRKMPRC